MKRSFGNPRDSRAMTLSIAAAVLLACACLRAQPPNATAREQLLRQRQQHAARVSRARDEQKWPEAIAAARRLLEIEQQLFGEQDHRVTDARHTLGHLQTLARLTPDQLARLDTASRSLREAGQLYARGKPRRAIPLARQAVEIQEELLGPKHRDYVTGLNNLAQLYHATGNYARAAPLLRKALDISRETLGLSHPGYAVQLNNLAGLYLSMGDYARAEPLLREALDTRTALLPKEHPDYAASLNSLAGVYYLLEQYDRAEPLFSEAAMIRRKALGEKHPLYADSLNNLAALYEAKGDFRRAESFYDRALSIREEALGREHPHYAAGLNNLAALHKSTGDYARAEEFYRRALEIRETVLGKEHPDYATGLNNLAALYRTMGEHRRAEPLYREALAVLRRLLDETFAVLSERQQLAMITSMRHTLDGYLSVTAAADSPQGSSYRYVLVWKGLVFRRQQQAHLLGGRPELAPLLEQLQETSSRLAALVFASGPVKPEARRAEFDRLSQRKGRLEAELSRRSEEFRKNREQVTPERLSAALPGGVALVDFLVYAKSSPHAQGEKKATPSQRHLAAFLVRSAGPVVRLELGPVEPIAQAIDVWRRTCGRPGSGAGAAGDLRRRLWLPLAERLEGVQTVLISPDGALTRFPFAALPGEKPHTYLIEELSLAVVPVPQALPELLEKARPTGGADDSASRASLLVLGDVDYDGSARPATEGDARAPISRRKGLSFQRLKNSRGEMLAVRDSFEMAYPQGEVRMLRGGQATETEFGQLAPRHRFLHITTHGFFAPAEMRSLLAPAAGRGGTDAVQTPAASPGRHVAAFHPGLLSGIALAGANSTSEGGSDDGILTAAEVAALNLSTVDLAVLSACETGLGPVAGGEGVLGLQRAFQISGTRSVVASLWKVSDETTRLLMERFYENLWEEKMGTLQALRQAQLSVLNERTQRGVYIEPIGPDAQSRRSPYDWAAFVLSGDWR